jgi:hypothetical protein
MSETKYDTAQHTQYLEERKLLIEAARESSRTFDQAVLAFGSAVFAASIAFLKDVAPKPQAFTLKWLGLSWGSFSLGLLAILFSFLFSHRACMFEINENGKQLEDASHDRKDNRWSLITDRCNFFCIGLLFLGLAFWSIFAIENLKYGESTVKDTNSPHSPQQVERGYVPQSPPAKAPSPAPSKTSPGPLKK